jgi:hypothetical protein
MDRYRSVMDFLFCELHPEWRMACRRFYIGNGPRLQELITEEQVVAYIKRLLVAVEVAYKLFEEDHRVSWTLYRWEVKNALQRAA